MSDKFPGHSKVTINVARVISIPTNKAVDITRMITMLEVYGSVFDPTMVAVVHITDTTSILYNLPIAGEEVLELEIQSDGTDRPFEKTFFVRKPDDLQFDPNGSVTTLTLHCVSIEHIRGMAKRVSKGVKEQISKTVENILKDDIRTDGEVNVEESEGIETLVLPSLPCWDTIEMLRQRAVSTKYKSPYLFFEDSKGFNFVTVEGLIEQRKKDKPPQTFTSEPYMPTAGDDPHKSSVMERQKKNVENLVILKKADTASFIGRGGAHNRVSVFDPLEKKLERIDTSYDKMKDEIVKQPLDDSFNPHRSARLLEIVSEPTIEYLVPFDAANKSSFMNNVGKRQIFNRHFGDTQLAFTMYSDTTLEPGDVLRLEIPLTTGSPEEDPQLTGNYMVTSFVHRIKDDQMFTDVEVYRFGFGQGVF